MKNLSIAITAWNSRDLLKGCLESVQRHIKDVEFELIVVDNGSDDGTAAFVEKDYPQAKLIRNPRNEGVSRGRNQAIQEASGRYVLLLDSDTEIESESIGSFLRFLDENKDIGLAGCKLFSFDGELQLTCRTLPRPIHVLFRRISFLKIVRNSQLLHDHILADWDHNAVREVEFLIGAFQIIRREVIGKVGLLNEKMFYGFEDADYCARVLQAGYKIIYYPFFNVKHYQRRVTGIKPLSRLALHNYLSYIRFYLRHRRFLEELSRRKILEYSSQG